MEIPRRITGCTTVGLGFASLEKIQVQQAAQDFESDLKEVIPPLAKVDKSKLDSENRETVEGIQNTCEQQLGFIRKADRTSIFSTYSLVSEGNDIRASDVLIFEFDYSKGKMSIRFSI